MAEETEGQEFDAGSAAGDVAGADPAAVALALGGADREKANAFLEEQTKLARDQRHHLTEQFKQQQEQLKNIRLQVWEKRFGLLLRIATGFVGLAIAAGLAFMIWGASQSNGLLIEAFSVPPDLAARGMTGEVVAAKLLDRLSQMQAETSANRAAKSYVSDWSKGGIKLDIPETGVSLTELDDFLRAKLGHDTHITGEIVRTASGISLTARTGTEGAESVTGLEADLEGLVRQLSENAYRLTQPFRFGMYLAEHDRLSEAIQAFKAIAETGPTPLDRAQGYGEWAQLSGEQDGIDIALRLFQRAMAAEPDNAAAELFLTDVFLFKSLPEQSVRESQRELTIVAGNKLGMLTGSQAAGFKATVQGNIDPLLGDFQDAAQEKTRNAQQNASSSAFASAELTLFEADEHDLSAARATLAESANDRNDFRAGLTALIRLKAKIQIDSEARDWAGVLSDADAFTPMFQKYPGLPSYLPTWTVPLTAYAEAKLGKIADAEKHIAATPADCYDCLIARARIAEVQGQHGRADYWFARAIDGQKSIPFAYSYWGQALMERGDYDGAVAKFTLANQKGPKFADPLEMWAETLMLQKHPDQAPAKFAEAEKYAPNWGRLHLKWGEALVYAGKKEDAAKQFTRAAQLDLTPSEKAELARHP